MGHDPVYINMLWQLPVAILCLAAGAAILTESPRPLWFGAAVAMLATLGDVATTNNAREMIIKGNYFGDYLKGYADDGILRMIGLQGTYLLAVTGLLIFAGLCCHLKRRIVAHEQGEKEAEPTSQT